MNSRVEFDTTDFQMSHGKMPRGTGNWAFFFKRNDSVDKAFWHNGSYTDAKKAAAVEAKARGVSVVYVGS